MSTQNPWHGCRKISPGCANYYVHRRDAEFGKDGSVVTRISNFDVPVKCNRKGDYKLQSDGKRVYTCTTSDFFLDEADGWRAEAWDIIRRRGGLDFVIITKRIHRSEVGLPGDQGSGYENVTICCICENQNRADYHLPISLELPIKHRTVIYEPILGQIDIRKYLTIGKIEGVTCGEESEPDARVYDFTWVPDSMERCVEHDMPFWLKQTGAKFKKGNKIYSIDRKAQMSQTQKAGINYRR